MKKIISLCLVAVLLMSGISVCFSAFAEDIPVSMLALSFDDEYIELNTHCTEGEVQNRIRESAAVGTQGVLVNTSNTWLTRRYSNGEGQPYRYIGIGRGEENVSTELNYSYEICLQLGKGYRWDDAIMLNNSSPVRWCDVPAFTLSVNGAPAENVDWAYYKGYLSIYIPHETASTQGIVTLVDIYEKDFSMTRGTARTFSTQVNAYDTDDSLIWTLEGAQSPDTTISQNGVLTCAADEPAEQLTVKATSAANAKKFDTVTVTLSDEPQTIDGITLAAQTKEITTGKSFHFQPSVSGTQLDKSYTCLLSGAFSQNTGVTDTGIVYVGIDETAETLTLTVISNYDSSVQVQATITVKQLDAREEVHLNFDAAAIVLDPNYTEGAVQSVIKTLEMQTDKNIVIKNRYLNYLNGVNMNGIGTGENQVTAQRKYFAQIDVVTDNTVTWPASVKAAVSYTPVSELEGFRVIVSGKECTDAYVRYMGDDYVDIYLPLPTAAHQHKAVTTAPTETTLGYTMHTCVCGDSYVDTYTAPTGKLTLKHAGRNASAVKVSWNNVKTATGYQVQISTKDGKKWDKNYNLKSGVNIYTFKNLAAGNNYKFRVRFFIKAKDGNNYYSPWSTTLNDPTLPAGTSLTKVTGASKAFTAQWKQNKAVTGYQVQYSTKSNFSGAKTVSVKSYKTLKTTVKKLSAKKTYYVRIRTYKTISKVNYFSTWSKAVKVKTK